MVSVKATVVSLAAAAGLLQMCAAPPAIIAAIVGGVIGGALPAGAILCSKYCPAGKRFEYGDDAELFDRALPPGVSKNDIHLCVQELNKQSKAGTHVKITNVNKSTANVAHVPQACMDLATILTGKPAQEGGPVPIPTGSSSLQYRGLTVKTRKHLAAALNK